VSKVQNDLVRSEQPSANPSVGWAVANPIRASRFPDAQWGRLVFLAVLGLLNAAFLTSLGLALFGYSSGPDARDVVVSVVVWGGLGANFVLLVVAGATRWILKRMEFRTD
jgi:hypothetical protein